MVDIYLTIDVDWAPDWAINQLAEYLTLNTIPATWFLTHISPATEALLTQSGLFEIGIHPNFLDGSSHGSNPHEVIEHCMLLAPGARSIRTHALMQSTRIFQTIVEITDIEIDCSIYLRDIPGSYQNVTSLPLAREESILRIPYQWEDDLEFQVSNPIWSGVEFFDRHSSDDYIMIDIHPIHFAMNSRSAREYELLKNSVSDLRTVDMDSHNGHDDNAIGTKSFLKELVHRAVESKKSRWRTISFISKLAISD